MLKAESGGGEERARKEGRDLSEREDKPNSKTSERLLCFGEYKSTVLCTFKIVCVSRLNSTDLEF